ncbi:LCP family protein [Calidifontibacter sp. DB0510]|uniref:LCP family protein n=1 Tax=Metallococcus carri TaxID=1656884 RepID=A0A967AZX8_9MICO|nr:LCP family protein [Metallococcus carri]NHN55507.1 LCP family protein [Metallococcus carri]NOP38309.1 LCP family protein [Calidifontibacter sp. DB2511S]
MPPEDDIPTSRAERRAQEQAADTAAADADDTALADGSEGDEGRQKPGCLKVGCLTLLTMAVIAALVAGGFAAFLYLKFDKQIQRSALLPSSSAGDPTRNPKAGDAQNILLLGSDSRDVTNMNDNARSDVIQLVHIDKNKQTVQVIHVPRDLYVSIPGHGKNKVNAAFAYGGVPLLVQTLQNLFGIHIDNAAVIGFQGFAKLTDQVGGVDLYVRQPYCEGDFGCWKAGWQHMNGKQALGFVRERHQLARGDIDRGVNQQAWIQAVMAKTLKKGTLANPVNVVNIVDDLTADKNFTVDQGWSTSALGNLGFQMRNLRTSNMSFYTTPYTGFKSIPGVGDVDLPDEPAIAALGKALYNDDFSGYEGQTNTVN